MKQRRGEQRFSYTTRQCRGMGRIHRNQIQRCPVHCQIRPDQAKKRKKKGQGELHSNAEWLELVLEWTHQDPDQSDSTYIDLWCVSFLHNWPDLLHTKKEQTRLQYAETATCSTLNDEATALLQTNLGRRLRPGEILGLSCDWSGLDFVGPVRAGLV